MDDRSKDDQSDPVSEVTSEANDAEFEIDYKKIAAETTIALTTGDYSSHDDVMRSARDWLQGAERSEPAAEAETQGRHSPRGQKL